MDSDSLVPRARSLMGARIVSAAERRPFADASFCVAPSGHAYPFERHVGGDRQPWPDRRRSPWRNAGTTSVMLSYLDLGFYVFLYE
jgi:hypothetical protein